jgi:5'-3' exonuclease
MFVSQPSDNIHPCKGIGKKAAIEILSECKSKLDFIKQVINVYKNGYKRFKGYEDYKDKIRLYYRLVYLEENIEFDYVSSINKI